MDPGDVPELVIHEVVSDISRFRRGAKRTADRLANLFDLTDNVLGLLRFLEPLAFIL